MNEIAIPKKLEPLVKAFFAECPDTAKRLVIQAVKAIYGDDNEKDPNDFFSKSHCITKEELEQICSLMQGLKPTDILEALMAAQIVVAHMIGMKRMASGSTENQNLGLKMLRHSLEASSQLHRKKRGIHQNITVNYNNYQEVKPLRQEVVIPIKKENYAD